MKTIAVDIDDVLAANAEGFVAFSNARWGTNLKPDDYTEHWAELWAIDFNEVAQRRDVLFKEKIFTKHRFFDEAKPVLNHLKKKYKLVILSSRSREVQADTHDWLASEFKDIFTEIHFANIWNKDEVHILDRLKLTKADVCRQIGADYLIDDQPKHCQAAAEAGITALLFGDYGWSKHTKLAPGMVRTKSWLDVQRFFDEQG